MSDDMNLTERLRSAHGTSGSSVAESAILLEAADEIDRLQTVGKIEQGAFDRLLAEIERMRAALTQIRGFVAVIDERNWRDMRLHIERQCHDEQDVNK